MINNSKITTFNHKTQLAGVMPGDANIEFVGNRNSKSVFWIQNGATHYFRDLPLEYFNLLKAKYLKDPAAVTYLQQVTEVLHKQVELYTYYLYGELDATPDIVNGKLSESENFRDQLDCPSLDFNSKNINIDAHVLTPRQIVIVDLIADDLPDKAIANLLGIKQSTFDFHKSNLFKAVSVTNKVALLKVCMRNKIIA